MLLVNAPYFRADGFTFICVNDTIYTVASKTGEWRKVSVGEPSYFGVTLTKDMYNTIKKDCTNVGTFRLE